MTTTPVGEAKAGEPVPAEDAEAAAWGREAVAKSLQTVTEACRQLVTLTSALLAGLAALSGQLQGVPPVARAVAAALLLGALASALWGSLPHLERGWDYASPPAVRAA